MTYSYNIMEMEQLFRRPIIKPRFRFFLLNPDETISSPIPDEDINIAGTSYNEQYQTGIRRTMTVELINIEKKYTPNINGIWVNTKIKFEAGIEKPDGTVLWFPCGVYLINSIDTSHNQAENIVSLNLSDKFSRFEGKMGILEGTYEIPKGTNIKKCIGDILWISAGEGYPLDSKPFLYDQQFETVSTPNTITKEAGSTFGEILQDLAMVLDAEMYYNEEGLLTFVPINRITDDLQKPTLWVYKDIELEYGEQNINYNFDEVVNEVHVIGNNIDNEIFAASAQNTNAASPICIQRIGRRISVIEDSNISADYKAQERANYELRLASIVNTTVNFQSSFLPFLTVNNLVEIHDDYYGWLGEKFIIQSISYSLENGNMTVGVSNMSNLPTFIGGR